MTRFLVTGAAGFIGFHTVRALLERGDEVVGVDNFNEYYDPSLKEDRVAAIGADAFRMIRADLVEADRTRRIFEDVRPDVVIHLAAQVGVRYSIENPGAYFRSNLIGFGNILEGCRRLAVRHLVYASSSSVYGGNAAMPFSVHDNVDHPLSPYAATKKSNELMAHSYSHLFGLPSTGLRFFTVYGPWGRPDMAYFLFTRAILRGESIKVFNHGEMSRDFTYIDDIVEGVLRVADRPATPNPSWSPISPDPGTSAAPYRVYNIGNSEPVDLMGFIRIIEDGLGKKAVLELLPMQAGDVTATFADVDDLARDMAFRPSTPLATGLGCFIDWFREYYSEPSV